MQTRIAARSLPSTIIESWKQKFATMRNRIYITTSWDDGSPLDLRVADLLAKHKIPGTFYVPRTSQRPTMGFTEIRQIARRFDVGAQTLDHLPLTSLSRDDSKQQVGGAKKWLEDLTGEECVAFCPPLGQFRQEHLPLIRDAGFRAIRTQELLSLDGPRQMAGLSLIPTTVQCYPHRASTYLKNALGHGAIGNILRYAGYLWCANWARLCQSMLELVLKRGGVLHLCGRSWEVEEARQWGELEGVLRMISCQSDSNSRISNSDLCDLTIVPGSIDEVYPEAALPLGD